MNHLKITPIVVRAGDVATIFDESLPSAYRKLGKLKKMYGKNIITYLDLFHHYDFSDQDILLMMGKEFYTSYMKFKQQAKDLNLLAA